MKRNLKIPAMAVRYPGRFLLQVLRHFKANQGMLLSGAVAYYTLLSIIPMFALILVGLSHFIDEQQLYNTILTNLKLVIPGHAERVAGQVWGFLKRRELVGIFGILFMLFFSSMAFTVLESAMAVIFSHRVRKLRRHFLINLSHHPLCIYISAGTWTNGGYAGCRRIGCPETHAYHHSRLGYEPGSDV
jgi:uncharacterized BrkB/YihY/UPF0761 family membrane protein